MFPLLADNDQRLLRPRQFIRREEPVEADCPTGLPFPYRQVGEHVGEAVDVFQHVQMMVRVMVVRVMGKIC